MNYVLGVAIIGFLVWFSYRQISQIVKYYKERKQKKPDEKQVTDDVQQVSETKEEQATKTETESK